MTGYPMIRNVCDMVLWHLIVFHRATGVLKSVTFQFFFFGFLCSLSTIPLVHWNTHTDTIKNYLIGIETKFCFNSSSWNFDCRFSSKVFDFFCFNFEINNCNRMLNGKLVRFSTWPLSRSSKNWLNFHCSSIRKIRTTQKKETLVVGVT